jgi:hypothetical protein
MKPTLVLCSFQKSLDPNEDTVALNIRSTQDKWHAIDKDDVYYYEKSGHISVTSNIAEDKRLMEQIDSLKKINSELYRFALGKTVGPFSSVLVKDVKNNSSTQPTSSKDEMKAKKLKKVNKQKSKKLKV